MWPFSRKEVVEPTCADEIKSIRAKISRIESDILDLIGGQELIRDKLLRKMQLKRKAAEDDIADDEPEKGKNPLEGKLL